MSDREAFEKWYFEDTGLRAVWVRPDERYTAATAMQERLWRAWQAALQSGEPVAWRLRRDGVDYGMTVYDKAQVGRYVQDGWQLVGELYTTPQPVVPQALIEKVTALCAAVENDEELPPIKYALKCSGLINEVKAILSVCKGDN